MRTDEDSKIVLIGLHWLQSYNLKLLAMYIEKLV